MGAAASAVPAAPPAVADSAAFPDLAVPALTGAPAARDGPTADETSAAAASDAPPACVGIPPLSEACFDFVWFGRQMSKCFGQLACFVMHAIAAAVAPSLNLTRPFGPSGTPSTMWAFTKSALISKSGSPAARLHVSPATRDMLKLLLRYTRPSTLAATGTCRNRQLSAFRLGSTMHIKRKPHTSAKSNIQSFDYSLGLLGAK